MCSNTTVEFLRDNVLVWTGNVLSADGFAVADAVGCAGFPFVALLACVSRGVNIVEKMHGIKE